MKTLIMLAIALVAAVSARAALGETQKQIWDRHGKPALVETNADGSTAWYWSKTNCFYGVTWDSAISVMESATLNEKEPDWSPSEARGVRDRLAARTDWKPLFSLEETRDSKIGCKRTARSVTVINMDASSRMKARAAAKQF